MTTSVFASEITFTDIVRDVRSSEESEEITFRRAAAIYYLNRSQVTFAEIKSQLLTSQSKKSPITITVDADTLVIQKVVPK